MTDLDELSRLLEQATPGPWEVYGMFPHCFEVCMADNYATKPVCASPRKANADAIVALRNAAEELVRDARRLAYLASFFSPMGLDANGNHPWMCRNNPARLRGPNLRAAIDAAIAQEQP
jgi:hypothetical protein